MNDKNAVIGVISRHLDTENSREFARRFAGTRNPEGFQAADVLEENRARTLAALHTALALHPLLREKLKTALNDLNYGLAAYLVLDPDIFENESVQNALQTNWDRERAFGIS